MHKRWFSLLSFSGRDWDQFNDFAAGAGMDVLFNFNLLQRDHETCEVNLTNARAILDYSYKMGYSKRLHFQIGNGM